MLCLGAVIEELLLGADKNGLEATGPQVHAYAGR
jgi:hypothetical protein